MNVDKPERIEEIENLLIKEKQKEETLYLIIKRLEDQGIYSMHSELIRDISFSCLMQGRYIERIQFIKESLVIKK